MKRISSILFFLLLAIHVGIVAIAGFDMPSLVLTITFTGWLWILCIALSAFSLPNVRTLKSMLFFGLLFVATTPLVSPILMVPVLSLLGLGVGFSTTALAFTGLVLQLLVFGLYLAADYTKSTTWSYRYLQCSAVCVLLAVLESGLIGIRFISV